MSGSIIVFPAGSVSLPVKTNRDLNMLIVLASGGAFEQLKVPPLLPVSIEECLP